MSKVLNESLAIICLIIAIALYVLGLFIMCACPGWYVLASLFAGLAVWLNRGRRWGYWLLLASCLAVTVLHFFAVMHEHKAKAEQIKRIETLQKQKAGQTNNSLVETNNH